MQKRIVAGIGLVVCLCQSVLAQTQEPYPVRVQRYVDRYKAVAIEEQRRSGIPAAITLGQGVLETQAGGSELCTIANNHFGIKCKKEWNGETYTYTDDAPDECFRRYGCANDSYKDHTEYLRTSKRYANLFLLSATDYSAWAKGLKQCGYATNPKYAQQLIKIIEDFHLQDYTYAALETTGPAAGGAATGDVIQMDYKFYQAAVADSPKYVYTSPAATADAPVDPGTIAPAPVNGVQEINGLRAFYAHKGDVLLEQAMKYNLRYARLLELNDLPDAPLETDMFVYLERKKTRGTHQRHIVQPNESLLQIAQAEGIQLRQLRQYNLLNAGEEPAAGSVLYLQQPATAKPAVQVVAGRQQQPVIIADNGNRDYVVTDRPSTGRNPTAGGIVIKENPVLASNTPQAEQAAPAVVTEEPVAQVAQETVTPEPASVPSNNTAAPVMTASSEPVNIANEPAAEEMAAAEPQDELSKLKSRLDKAVYGGNKPAASAPKTDRPAVTAAPAPVTAPAVTTVVVPAATEGGKYYTVKKGDTVFGIAKQHNVSIQQLRDWNHLNFEAIQTGQKLRVQP